MCQRTQISRCQLVIPGTIRWCEYSTATARLCLQLGFACVLTTPLLERRRYHHSPIKLNNPGRPAPTTGPGTGVGANAEVMMKEPTSPVGGIPVLLNANVSPIV